MRLAHILQRQGYRLHLRLVALCQAISLEPPYYTKIEFQGHPHQQETHLGKYRSKNHLLLYALLNLLG